MAQFLAGCAGMMDAIATLLPAALDHPDFVSGETFFTMSKAWRERPPIKTLEANRVEQRQYWLEWLGPEVNTSGSVLTHAAIACMNEARIRAGN